MQQYFCLNIIAICLCRYAWSHGITPRTMDVISVRGGLTVQERGVRTSFTFRRVRQSECCCSYHNYCNSWRPEKVSENIASKLEAIHVHEVNMKYFLFYI